MLRWTAAPDFSARLEIVVAFVAYFTSSIFTTSVLPRSERSLTPLTGEPRVGPFALAATAYGAARQATRHQLPRTRRDPR
jgi:hypothetical protein